MFEFFKRKKSQKHKFEGEIASLPADDPTLKTFTEEAQEGVQYLIDFMEKNRDEDPELFRYAIKTEFVEDENSEHMWVQVTRCDDDIFYGRLANEPNTIKFIKYGDHIEVHREHVEDWILQDFLTKTEVGGFSRDYLRDKGKIKENE